MDPSLADLPRILDSEDVTDEIADCVRHCAKLAIYPMDSAEQHGSGVASACQMVISVSPDTGSYSLQAFGFRGVVRDV
ncbi:MAG: hypothetical protein SGI99_00195 [Pseudomonadota bacterium]|nr:hypothetical protein [Pseudomonadota bacterium]